MVALFTIARIWKQLKCPLVEEWIRKIHIYIYMCVCVCVHIYGILLSHKKKQNHANCRDVSEPRDYHADLSKKDKRK